MSTAIVYASKHGTTEKISQLLSTKTNDEDIVLFNLNEIQLPNILPFESVIIGGSIYAGKIQQSVLTFIDSFKNELLTKKVGLFVCCMLEDCAVDEFEKSFPNELKKHACAKGIFGGELVFEELNFIEQTMIHHIAKINYPVSNINHTEIDNFAKLFFN